MLKMLKTEEEEHKFITESITSKVIRPVLDDYGIDYDENFIVNGTGRFVVGGPLADTGLTGRKIIVDTYGGYARHGGGAFSGKDPSKVDRSAAYMARYVAKHIVAVGLASCCEIQLAYSIGVAEPVSVMINTFDTGIVPDKSLEQIVAKYFDLTPYGIINTLDLLRPIYFPTSCYGHFGREDCLFPWEELNMLDTLRADEFVGEALASQSNFKEV